MFAIKNYGLMWERKYTHYGWAGVAGHSNGYRRGVAKADFSEQSSACILYDKDFKPIYVGQAGPKVQGSLKFEQRVDDHVVEKTLGDILDNQEPIETKSKPR